MDNSGKEDCLWESVSLAELPQVAQGLIEQGKGVRVWRLEGSMGAGKTTLVKSICAQLGVTDVVNSPTFSLVNEYLTGQGESIFHFDFYRMEHPEEAIAIGIDEYFDSGSLCLLEWSSRIEAYLPPSYFTVSITPTGADTRRISCTHYE
ncbi:MAG TPA: tRNA (adenosine(37)-N6)-threonylcarbamoyltransferase complex ATPase subunit type 1 TsaE [Cytophagales bacterium]|nr:tRNA (adenosine(37)-N6)-threonylcarbamoyltransferase complex ATPase subunit type 1 TsaE [Cytophagales bacterium]HAA22604.1 tRNA (adenosine(37)-N6)-threonylcarbamoyltransferase complex ATPase subunit type 1 TsaE [Cytophagales bacterium]HAP63550.1 tRNA (adenosine(37)-N6)-threonylcarbamoyltransferase complex ATPase subunit type 1 TsaE [Cytophagales bacterium]